MNENTSKTGFFDSYTTEEGEATARGWAGIALATFGVVIILLGRLAHANADIYYINTGAFWTGGLLAGLGCAIVIAGVWVEFRNFARAGKLRKAYKKAHPELFDSAGDPVPTLKVGP